MSHLAWHSWQNVSVALRTSAIAPGHPKYPEIRELRDNAYTAMVRSQRLYREHIKEHGCGAPGPKEPDWEWVN